MLGRLLGLIGSASLGVNLLVGQTAPGRYAVILDATPAAEQFTNQAAMTSQAAATYRTALETTQRAVRAQLAGRQIEITGAATTLLNAIFVAISPDQLDQGLDQIRVMPGVKGVVPLRRIHQNLNQATQLMNAPAAWNAIGGLQNAGAGVKIAIIDSGIDQTHPAFQDASLALPAGYPKCGTDECAFTTNKVIVARSYIRQVAAGTGPNPAGNSRPDDYSPRDQGGHGTAVASAAAGVSNKGLVQFSGMAPKAYLGNYKIYGTPGLNDSPTEDALIHAVEDAVADGMDIISFSSGAPAFTGPLDTGTACGQPSGVPCDLLAQVFENAVRQGVVVVAAAGNEGSTGVSANAPSYGTVNSPGNAPSVIAVGATTNSHIFLETVRVPGADSQPNLQAIAVRAGDAFVPTGALTAPLRDVAQLGNDGQACSPLPFTSLIGSVALVLRGTCSASAKLSNAQNAGALGVILYMADTSTLIGPAGVSGFSIPAVNISNADGLALKSFLALHPDHLVTIDPAGIEQSATFDDVAAFSSVGPGTGDGGLKPDVLGVGTDMYMAAQSFNPGGELYSANRYGVANGTSFSTPLVSGAAALVKQRHPNFTAAQIKSALVNTASNTVHSDELGGIVDVRWTGAGKVDAAAASNATVTVVPATLSFGLWNAAPPKPISLQLTNTGVEAISLAVTVVPVNGSASSSVTVDRSTVLLAAHSAATVTVSLTGTQTAPGSFSGNILMNGTALSLHVPYLSTKPSGTPVNMIPLSGSFFDGAVGSPSDEGAVVVQLIDSVGAGVPGIPVTFIARSGGAFLNADEVTDVNGIAAAVPSFGTQPGIYLFTVTAAGLRADLTGFARARPALSTAGVLNGASFEQGPAAPGSYISIFGAALSDVTDFAGYPRLPLQIDAASVSFDVPSAQLSVPGHLTYVSPTQINLQVPWELRGQSAAQVKVTLSFVNGNLITVPLTDYAPAFFENSSLVSAQDSAARAITLANPARRGQTVQLYANGLGPVTNQPASGEAALALPLSETTAQPIVSIGGRQAVVMFSGLAPGYAGLYRVDAVVPDSLDSGTQPISISIGNKTSKASKIPIQ